MRLIALMKKLLKYSYVFILCILILIVFSLAYGFSIVDKIYNPYGRKIYSFHDHRL
jgi:hypothetical protein